MNSFLEIHLDPALLGIHLPFVFLCWTSWNCRPCPWSEPWHPVTCLISFLPIIFSKNVVFLLSIFLLHWFILLLCLISLFYFGISNLLRIVDLLFLSDVVFCGDSEFLGPVEFGLSVSEILPFLSSIELQSVISSYWGRWQPHTRYRLREVSGSNRMLQWSKIQSSAGK